MRGILVIKYHTSEVLYLCVYLGLTWDMDFALACGNSVLVKTCVIFFPPYTGRES